MSKFRCYKCNIFLTKNNWQKSCQKQKRYVCKLCKNLLKKNKRFLIKKEVFEKYGGRCSCCQEDNLLFLTIDHIDGSGANHRRSLIKKTKRKARLSSSDFYLWLKKNNYPKDNYQILCFNCNSAKHINGICPHQENKT